MIDMSATTIPKSNQLNADDLIGKSITIKITKVSACGGDQPIAVSFENDGGKPWLPCKGMRRVLIYVWGNDGKSYVGRALTLYRDENVVFGGIKVGGIRISHMSGIADPVTLALTASKASRKPFTVQPLADAPPPQEVRPLTAEEIEAIKKAILDGIISINTLGELGAYTKANGAAYKMLPASYQEEVKHALSLHKVALQETEITMGG